MAKAKDANQSEIVRALREVGASVALTFTLGKGFPDAVVGFRGLNYLAEIKDGSKPPSRRKLTPAEQEFHDNWKGQIAVLNNVDEALRMIGVI